jgi:O-glycosyl hydrolase
MRRFIHYRWRCAGLLVALTFVTTAFVQFNPSSTVTIDFRQTLQDWDGFGFNYVEVPQTRDYKREPQEYGGFSWLNETQRQEILDLIFGADGLQPGVVKMFLDPFHEGLTKADNDNNDPNVIDPSRFDHTTTTKWMRYFVRAGLQKTRARGGDLQIITTLYGPPPWMTKQKFVRGRDLDPAEKHEMAEYLVAWAKYLRDEEKFPVKYISLHNEGEDFIRWPMDGKTAGSPRHDYNLYWPPPQVNEMMKLTRQMLDRHGLRDIGVTPGETTNWFRFVAWHYAPTIANDDEALRSMGLITSHGFTGQDQWYSDWRSDGIDLLRLKRPELHAWTTSMTWGKMDALLAEDLRQQVYTAKVNAAIPWAGIQTDQWVGGDPNPGTAFRVAVDKRSYTVENGYWYYKPIARAGQPGMKVAAVSSSDAAIRALAFASNGTRNPDAFVIINTKRDAGSGGAKAITIQVQGTSGQTFTAYRTAEQSRETYASLGKFTVTNGILPYTAPDNSVTAFFAVQ